MKSKEVMKLMNISRTTLFYYTKNGKIKVTKFDNGYYDYDEESVFKLLSINTDLIRKNISVLNKK